MPETSAVSVSPTWAVPEMVGAPVAGLLGLAATGPVAALVSDSAKPAPSVKVTVTVMALPCSLPVRVWLPAVAPLMAVPSADHW